MENIKSVTARKKAVLLLLAASCLFVAFLGAALVVEAAGNDETEYIYFDLSAGGVSVNGSAYKGYVYQKDAEGNFSTVTVSGTIEQNQAYYVYQSYLTDNIPDGYCTDNGDGTKTAILPTRTPVTVDGESWADYVTNNSDVEAVIAQWIISADEAQRTSTKNTISVTGQVNVTLVIDNIWSSFHEKNTSKRTGGLSFYPAAQNSHLTVEMKGDNRFGNVFYSNSYTTTTVTFVEKEAGASLTAANLKANSNENYWCAAIGGNDSGQDSARGIVFNSGTIFAGTNAKDDCTAIGGGGNGYGGITVNGGRVTAAVTSSGAAIGGGIGKNSNGGKAEVYINGGEVYAYNFSCSSGSYSQQGVTYIPSAAIGGGSSARAVCDACTVKIMGGKVYAQSVGGTAIGGGSSADNTGGSATVTIGGGKTISPSGKLGAAKVEISGGTIHGQIIMAAGAATQCSFSMSGGDINNSGNDGSYVFLRENGGAIYMDDPAGVAELSGGSISECSAVNGGALYITAGSFTLSGTGVIESCTASGNGGAVYMGGGTFTMSGGTLSHNRAANGAGAYLLDGTLTVSGGTVNDNVAIENGGAGYLGGGEMTVLGGVLTRNRATNGAGAYLAAGTMTVSGGSLLENEASYDGGAIYLGGGTFNVSGGSVSSNTALNGAGAYIQNGTLNVKSGHMGENTATERGGAAYLGGGEMIISGGTVTSNSAVNGAGAYIADGTLSITGGSIEQNRAAENGGGAYLSGGELTITDGTITGNTAIEGGAAYVDNGVVTVSGGMISENKASMHGGAFFITNGNYVMKGGVITLNEAVGGDGGAIYVSASQNNAAITVYSGTVTDNKACKNGGAFAVHGRGGVAFTITVGSKTDHTGRDNAHACIDDPDKDEPCPIITNNTSGENGGAVSITGSYEAVMNMYCLIEKGNKVGDGVSPSNFMSVEGGTLNISTNGDGTQQNYGNIIIDSTIHVTGGNVTISGSGSNPMFKHPVTVDVDTEHNSNFTDLRTGGDARTIQYFENFEHEGELSGQYVLIDSLNSDPHEVHASLYSISGYAMEGWTLMTTDSEGNHIPTSRFFIGGDIVTDEGDLIFYAKWTVVGYTVVFKPGTDNYKGSMSPQTFEYSESKALTKNSFIRVGYVFLHWVDENDAAKIYEDREEVSKLSAVHGTKINLVAVWQICNHGDMDSYSLTSTENSAVRQCPCLGYSETVSVSGVNAVYNEKPHGTEIRYDRKSLNGISPADVWELSLLYNGKSNGGQILSNATEAPIDAGSYTANVKVTDTVSISAVIFIGRAKRGESPDNPEYTTVVDNNGTPDNKDDDINIILISSPYVNDDGVGERIPLEYQFSWYVGSQLRQSDWLEWDDENPPNQELSVAYTNYYVDVRYKETPNYLASEIVRGTSVIVWNGNVIFEFTSAKGLSHSHTTSGQSDGITVTLTPSDGYYIYNPTFTATATEGYTLPAIDNRSIESNSWVLWIHDIEKANASDGVTVKVTFDGAERLVSINADTVRDEVFGDIADSGEACVSISKDSAYTVHFAIENYRHYSQPKISFSSAIPEGSSVIMIDRADMTYWSYTAGSDVTAIPLSDFIRMGTVNSRYDVGEKQTLSLQFAIDFSGCETPSAAASLITSFTATPIQLENLSTVPEMPTEDEAVSHITLALIPAFTVENDLGEINTSLSHTFFYQFAHTAAENVGASKWKGKAGILVVEALNGALLPADARLQVKIGDSTKTYSMKGGKFIVALSEDDDSALLTLVSDMMPNADRSFEFSITLHSSATAVNTTPTAQKLGEGAVNIAYTVKKTSKPAVNAELRGEIPKYDGNVMSDLNFTVHTQGLAQDDKVTVSLYVKDKYGVYTFTTQSAELDMVGASVDSSLSLSTFAEEMDKAYGSLSFMLLAEVFDSTGELLDSVPLYFVLSDERQ